MNFFTLNKMILLIILFSPLVLSNLIQDIITEHARYSRGSGLAILTSKGNQTEQFFAGFKSAINKEPVTENTIFEIGSITKVFTALVLLESINNQIISNINDPINNYLPPNVSIFKCNFTQITFKHLVTHTSTLPRDLNNIISIHIEELEEFINNYKCSEQPGTKYLYSNLGFVILGYTLQHILNKTFDEMVYEAVTSKLNMNDTKCFIGDNPNLTIGHSFTKEEPYLGRTSVSCSSGGLFSNLKDMKTFLLANINEGNSSISKLLRQSHKLLFPNGDKSLAFAWHLKNSNENTQIIHHNGATFGFSSYIGFDKEKQKGVVILSNVVDHSLDSFGQSVLRQ